jgi:hypothetical protein
MGDHSLAALDTNLISSFSNWFIQYYLLSNRYLSNIDTGPFKPTASAAAFDAVEVLIIILRFEIINFPLVLLGSHKSLLNGNFSWKRAISSLSFVRLSKKCCLTIY